VPFRPSTRTVGDVCRRTVERRTCCNNDLDTRHSDTRPLAWCPAPEAALTAGALLPPACLGTLARGAQIIFGIGLNQLSDYCEERVPDSIASSKVMRNGIGSVAAGIVAGYLSHVPHNLSTMKLLQPHLSYAAHFQALVKQAEAHVPVGIPAGGPRRTFAMLRTIFWPIGVGIRSTQIIGSFVLLNGISHMLDIRNRE